MRRPTRRAFGISLLAAAFAPIAYGTPRLAEQAGATRTAWPPDRLNNVTEWGIYRGDKGATQYSSISQINTTNVHRLEVAWQYKHGQRVAYLLAARQADSKVSNHTLPVMTAPGSLPAARSRWRSTHTPREGP